LDELTEEKIKVINHRIGDLEAEVKDIKDLTIAISTVNNKVDSLSDDMTEVKKDLKEIIKRPVDNWNKFYMAVACAVASGIV